MSAVPGADIIVPLTVWPRSTRRAPRELLSYRLAPEAVDRDDVNIEHFGDAEVGQQYRVQSRPYSASTRLGACAGSSSFGVQSS